MNTEMHYSNRPAAAGTPSGPLARHKKALGVGAAVLASTLLVWAATGFTREPPQQQPPPPGMVMGTTDVSLAPDAPQWKVLRLAAAKPAMVRWSDPVPARVKIDETRASVIGSPLSGRITAVYVELGQVVKAGAPLFSVASPDIAGLRAERDKAAVDLEVSKTQLDRIQAMVAAHAVPAKDALEANQQQRQAQLALKLAQSKLASLKVSTRANNAFTVISPRDGIVVEKNLLPSQEVSPGAALVSVADLSDVWVVADLFEANAWGITPGTAVRISSPALPEFSAETKVDMVSAVVDPTSHTVPVRVKLPNADGQLKPNMYAQMRFAVKPTPGAVDVAASALVSDGNRQYVYVQGAQGQFSRREVVAKSAYEGRVPIVKGLNPGDIVVEEGAILLDNQISFSR